MMDDISKKTKKIKIIFLWRYIVYFLLALLILSIPLTIILNADDSNKRMGLNIINEIRKKVKPRPLANKVEPLDNMIYFGVYQEDAPFKIKDLDNFQKKSGKEVSILMWYQPWSDSGRNIFDQKVVDFLIKKGVTPMISWEPWDPGSDPKKLKNPSSQPKYRLKNIINGNFDSIIKMWARDIKSYGGPVMLRPLHEMNGTWYPWGGPVNSNKPEEFIEAWRHIYNIFKKEGATNVTWVWSVNNQSVPAEKWHKISIYYPGDEYVDWTSISGFNWGTSSEWSKWKTFNEGYIDIINELSNIKKPIIISEISCVENGGDKSKWIIEAFQNIKEKYPGIKGIIWYNRRDSKNQDWRFDTSTESAIAFRQAISDPYFSNQTTPALKDFLRRWIGTSIKK